MLAFGLAGLQAESSRPLAIVEIIYTLHFKEKIGGGSGGGDGKHDLASGRPAGRLHLSFLLVCA